MYKDFTFDGKVTRFIPVSSWDLYHRFPSIERLKEIIKAHGLLKRGIAFKKEGSDDLEINEKRWCEFVKDTPGLFKSLLGEIYAS